MDNVQNIIKAIQLGLRRGYNQNLRFKNKFISFESKMTEYLLTVAVANELSEINNYGKLVNIEVEYSLCQFYNNAFPIGIWTNENDLFTSSEYIKREYEADPSKKRIDIAVMYDDNNGLINKYRSLHGVEIKSVNTHYSGIINDLGRLSDSMITDFDRTGTNSIQSCYSAFIKSYSDNSKPTLKSEIENNCKKIINFLDKKLNEKFRNQKIYKSLSYSIHTENIDSSSFEEYYEQNKHIPDFEIGWDPDSETGSVLGVIIEINRL